MTTEAPTSIPTDIAALTAPWLTELLNSAGHSAVVESVTAQAVGSGQMAGSYRLHLEYAGSGALPPTMVAKIATGPAEQRTFAAGAFRNEVRFYRELAPLVDVPTPEAYASTISEAGTEFVLLLQDMTPARQGDQIAGCTVDQARTIAISAAGLHAPLWCDAKLIEPSAFPLPTESDADTMQEFLAPMAEVFRDRFPLDAEQARAVDHLVARARDWLIAPRPAFSLVHSDFRIDNVLFGPDDRLTVVDWQTIASGDPLRDIAFLLSTSLDAPDRRRHERAIVAAYHDALCRRGVTGFSAEQCWAGYVDGLLHTLLVVVFGAAAAQPSERGDRMFQTMLARGAAALTDLVPDVAG